MQFDNSKIKRQILHMKRSFSNYPSSNEDTELRIKQTIDTGIWPLVNHITSFGGYPQEYVLGIIKLSNFPFEKEEKDKWLNTFSYKVNDIDVIYFHTFTEKDAKDMDSTLGEIMYALNAMKIALPFVSLDIEDASECGNINLAAYIID